MFAGAARTHVSSPHRRLPEWDVPVQGDATACCKGAAFLPRGGVRRAVSTHADDVDLMPACATSTCDTPPQMLYQDFSSPPADAGQSRYISRRIAEFSRNASRAGA